MLLLDKKRYVHGDVSKDFVIEESLKLDRGDRVYLQSSTDELRPTILFDIEFDIMKSSFSGFLIQEFEDWNFPQKNYKNWLANSLLMYLCEISQFRITLAQNENIQLAMIAAF